MGDLYSRIAAKYGVSRDYVKMLAYMWTYGKPRKSDEEIEELVSVFLPQPPNPLKGLDI